MKVAIPREIKNNEFRVAITPAGVHDLVAHGHEVIVETDAGTGSSITDSEYRDAGARIAKTAEETWASADMLLKVKDLLYGHKYTIAGAKKKLRTEGVEPVDASDPSSREARELRAALQGLREDLVRTIEEINGL